MKILACTDGSEQSRKALTEAAKIAKELNKAEITVIFVDDFPPIITTDEGGFFSGDYLTDETRERLDKEKAKIKKLIMEKAEKVFDDYGFTIDKVVQKGHPASVIIKVASEGGFNLVVLGSRGLGSMKKVLLGSVSNAVAQEAKTNVLIVK